MAFLSREEKGYFKFVIFIKISQLFDQLQNARYIAGTCNQVWVHVRWRYLQFHKDDFIVEKWQKSPQLQFGDMILQYHKNIMPLIAFFHFSIMFRINDLTPQSIKFWALIFVTGPLRQIIVYINHPHTIEDMARWFEFHWNF